MTTDAPAKPPAQQVRPPLAELLTIALPTIASMASFSAMQFVDALMVARVGPEPHHVAAQGNGGMSNWVLLSVFFGVASLINTYVSQNVGAGRPQFASRYAWAGIWGGVALWPLMIVAALVIPHVFSLAGHDGELLRLETQYAQILLVGSILKLCGKGASEFFFGIHRPAVVTVAVVAGNLTNIAANYIFIFGRISIPQLDGVLPGWSSLSAALAPIDDALPAMGTTGAALGTVVGYLVETGIQFAAFLGPKINAEFQTRAAWKSWVPEAKRIVSLGWPAGVQMGNETVCWWFLTGYLLGAGGAAAAAASGVTDPELIREAAETENAVGWIALRYMHASFMPTVGLSIAITAIVGRYMGMGRPDIAERRSWFALAIAGGYMGLCAILMVLFKDPLISLFIDESATGGVRERMIDVGSRVMIAGALFQLFDSVGIMLIGSLRGAGDTKWPGLANVLCSWVFLVGGGLLTIELFPSLGSVGPWIAAAAFIAALGITMLARFIWGPWRTIDLVNTDATTELAGAAALAATIPTPPEPEPRPSNIS